MAADYINALGGKANVGSLVNCATRIRAVVKDPGKVKESDNFKQLGAIDFKRHHNLVQIVIGLDVQQLLEAMRNQLNFTNASSLDEYGLTADGERARILFECLGLPDNIQRITVGGTAIVVQVADPEWVDPYDVILQLNIGVKYLTKQGHQVRITMNHATGIARELNHMLKQTQKQTKE
ncbi:PTS transporter subunit EIIB [Lacticaseibacillus zeae]|nr:PTS transporter subunit EIIB [Lacticaseibacillus zeae]